jgi:hypothetical protein
MPIDASIVTPGPDFIFNSVMWLILIGGFAFAGWQILKMLEG